MAAAFCATARAATDAVSVAMVVAWVAANDASEAKARIVVSAPSVAAVNTGRRRSPSSARRSSSRFSCLSSCACTVLFCTLNSLTTLTPSAYASLAVRCAVSTSVSLPASVESTPTARVPLRFMPSNMGARSAKPPFCCMVSRKSLRARLASVLSSSANCCTSRPASCANLAGSWYILVSSCENTVADVSTCCIFWSSTEAKPRMSAWLMPACCATPATRAANSTM